jgi:hypothetical protein
LVDDSGRGENSSRPGQWSWLYSVLMIGPVHGKQSGRREGLLNDEFECRWVSAETCD